MIGFGQQTYVPDNWFEAYLENNGLGNGIQSDDSVFTSAIDTVTYLDLTNSFAIGIFDLTGIEDFSSLTYLDISYNLLATVDLSQNILLTELYCSDNQLSSLDLSSNINLQYLYCSTQNISTLILPNSNTLLELSFGFNYVTSIDLSMYTNLIYLDCAYNGITDLDLSNNSSLTSLIAQEGSLHNLDLRNGNNYNMIEMLCFGNDNLTCINVDDSVWSTNNWTVTNGDIDTQQYFSVNCSQPTSVEEYNLTRELFKVTDLLGRETKGKKNEPLFYIYDDGTVEKKIFIE